MDKVMKILLPFLLILLSACEPQQDQATSSTGTEIAPKFKSEPAQELPQKTDQTNKQVAGRVLQYGLYTLVKGGEIVDDAKTTTGKGVSKPVITRDRTVERIPLVRNKYMAYQYRLSNIADKSRVKLRRVLKHPEFKLPDGSTTTGSDFSIVKKVNRGKVFAYDAYALNEDYEMVEGEWTFQIWYKGDKLVEQRFITYHPDDEEMAKLTAPSWLDKKAVASLKSQKRRTE
jgi:hypothetical protein